MTIIIKAELQYFMLISANGILIFKCNMNVPILHLHLYWNDVGWGLSWNIIRNVPSIISVGIASDHLCNILSLIFPQVSNWMKLWAFGLLYNLLHVFSKINSVVLSIFGCIYMHDALPFLYYHCDCQTLSPFLISK